MYLLENAAFLICFFRHLAGDSRSRDSGSRSCFSAALAARISLPSWKTVLTQQHNRHRPEWMDEPVEVLEHR